MEKTKIVINRKSVMGGSAVSCVVKIDDSIVGKIANGKQFECEVENGEHIISISMWKKETIIKVNINGENANFMTKFNAKTSKMDIYANGEKLPEEKVQAHSTSKADANSISSVNLRPGTITCKVCGAAISPRAKRCPHCGEPTPAEKVSQTAIGCVVGPFIAILILILVCIFIGFFAGFLG